jgi:hypothetical protein
MHTIYIALGIYTVPENPCQILTVEVVADINCLIWREASRCKGADGTESR